MKYNDLNWGQMEAIVNKLGGMEGVDAFLKGRAVLTYKEHVINLDAEPRIPYDGWKVEEHKKGGQFVWDPKKVALFLSKKQQDGNSIEGNKLRKELADKPVFNANLLDYLLDNLHLIPEEWKKDEKGNTLYIFFFGTVYRYSDGSLYVRYLCFVEGRWRQGNRWLDNDWGSDNPSAVFAS